VFRGPWKRNPSVAMLLPEMLPDKVGAGRTDSLISRKRGPSTPDGRSGQTSSIGCLVSHNTPHPPVLRKECGNA